MKLINPSVELITEMNPIKLIENAGRICYKSEAKQDTDSAKKFFAKLANSKHYAMLEHGHVTFCVRGVELSEHFLSTPYLIWSRVDDENYHICYNITCSASHLVNGIADEGIYNTDKYVFMNMGKLFFDYYLDDSSDMVDQDDKIGVQIQMFEHPLRMSNLSFTEALKHTFLSFKFVCDRGVSHELVRHRCSVAQESQRYVNYAKEKFGAEISFIKPHDWDERSDERKNLFEAQLTAAEEAYMSEINSGVSPQMARALLPNATKTEVILTMNIKQWIHFIDLRSKGTTGNPHPDMKLLADQVSTTLNNYIEGLLNLRNV